MLLAGLRRDRRELTNSHCALQGDLTEVLLAITTSSSPEGGGFDSMLEGLRRDRRGPTNSHCVLLGDLTEVLLAIATSSSSEDE